MEILLELRDAVGREQPLRVDWQIDFPHLVWIACFNQKFRMHGSFSRSGSATEHSRLSSQTLNDLTNAFGVKLGGACNENLTIFAGNVRNDRAVSTQCRANLRDNQSATAKACGDRRAVKPGGPTAANNCGFRRIDPL